LPLEALNSSKSVSPVPVIVSSKDEPTTVQIRPVRVSVKPQLSVAVPVDRSTETPSVLAPASSNPSSRYDTVMKPLASAWMVSAPDPPTTKPPAVMASPPPRAFTNWKAAEIESSPVLPFTPSMPISVSVEPPLSTARPLIRSTETPPD